MNYSSSAYLNYYKWQKWNIIILLVDKLGLLTSNRLNSKRNCHNFSHERQNDRVWQNDFIDGLLFINQYVYNVVYVDIIKVGPQNISF